MTFISTQKQTWHAIRESWLGAETVNGPGSTLHCTTSLRTELPALLARHHITSVLDAPCGDRNWSQHIDFTDYTGWDIDDVQIAADKQRWPQHTFTVCNLLTVRKIPAVDLIICRDFLIHLPNDRITAVLNKFIASDATYLLASNHPDEHNTTDLPAEGQDGYAAYWQRPTNLQAEPFTLTHKIDAITEPHHPVAANTEMALFDLRAQRAH